MKPQNAYGNIPFFSPGGILMFKGNERKVNFYKKNNLIESYENGFRLLFEPKGLGYNKSEHGSQLLSIFRENKCVVSGEEDVAVLTRHHIVPVLFRKWMPEELKSNSFQLIVFIRTDLHGHYTKEEQKFYLEVEKKYNVTGFQDTIFFHEENFLKKKACVNTLLKYSHLIPSERLQVIKTQFEFYTGIDANITNYQIVSDEIKAIKKKYYKNADYNFGKCVVEKVTDFKEFEKMWFDHFISTMKPRFLPEDLKQLY
jgi:hypothetical protein